MYAAVQKICLFSFILVNKTQFFGIFHPLFVKFLKKARRVRVLKQALQKQLIVCKMLHEIARHEFHVIEFREIENVRLRQHGRGNVQTLTNLRQIIKKVGVGQPLAKLVHDLLFNFSVDH